MSVWHRCPCPGQSSPTKNEVEERAITLIIIGRFYPKSNLTIFYDYVPEYKIWIQYTNQSFIKKILVGKHLLKVEKGPNSHNNGLIFTLIGTWPLFYDYIPVCYIWIQYTNVFKRYQTETIFQHWKRTVTPNIIGGFYPKSNLTYIL